MNINNNKTARTNKITTTVIIGLATLVIGLMIGAATAETGTGLLTRTRKADTRKGNEVTNQMSSAASSSKPGGLNAWDPFQEIRNMQAQMDQSFDQMFDQFRMDPQFSVFRESPGYSLSLDVRDLKDHYEIRAYLPDAKASNVHVSVKNGQTLKVQVNSKQTEKSDQKNMAASVTELGQYEQEVLLPTPVKADQMKIKRESHELVITIPKAA